MRPDDHGHGRAGTATHRFLEPVLGPAAGVLAIHAQHFVARGDEVPVQPPFKAGLRGTALDVHLGPRHLTLVLAYESLISSSA